MQLRDRVLQWVHPATYLGGNALTLIGAVLTTSTAITMIGVWLVESTGRTVHPYAGIVIFLVLPALFVFGLVLMPLGVVWHRQHLHRRGESLTAASGQTFAIRSCSGHCLSLDCSAS